MSEEIKSMATSEKTEVSSLPAAVPARRGRGIDLSKLTPEQLTLHKRSISTNSARARAIKKKASSFVYDSKLEPTKSEAKEILTARGLRNPHVINTCYDLGLIAAEQMGVTPNR